MNINCYFLLATPHTEKRTSKGSVPERRVNELATSVRTRLEKWMLVSHLRKWYSYSMLVAGDSWVHKRSQTCMMLQLAEVHMQLNLLPYNWISVLLGKVGITDCTSWRYECNTCYWSHVLAAVALSNWRIGTFIRAQILYHYSTQHTISLLVPGGGLDVIGWGCFRIGCWRRYFGPMEESRWVVNELDKNIPHLFGRQILKNIFDSLRTGDNAWKIRSNGDIYRLISGVDIVKI